MILELTQQSLKGNLIQMTFLSGYIPLNVSLSTRRYQMTRKLNLLLLDCANMNLYGGLTFVLKGLEIEKTRFVHGRRCKLS